MADIVMVAIFVAFCAICIAYVTWCDRIIGADSLSAADAPGGRALETEEVPA